MSNHEDWKSPQVTSLYLLFHLGVVGHCHGVAQVGGSFPGELVDVHRDAIRVLDHPRDDENTRMELRYVCDVTAEHGGVKNRPFRFPCAGRKPENGPANLFARSVVRLYMIYERLGQLRP